MLLVMFDLIAHDLF